MIEYKKHTLKNGLRVVVHRDRTTPMVAVNVLYDVGARDETPDKTGFAHLFEHLMFGGTKSIPSFDGPVQQVGGENNAWTSNDFTNYYVTVPAINVETAFWLEADRMNELDFSEKSLDVQRKVVIEEFKQRYLNQPYGDIPLLIRDLAYKVHPYRWPTIGKDISHIQNAALTDVKDFFYKHYAPNNAVLTVAGNVDPDHIFKLAEKWFGSIPRRDVPQRDLPQEPPQKEARFLTVERDVPAPYIQMVFHNGRRTDADFYANDLLSDLFANGQSARLFQSLIKEQRLFSDVNAYVAGDRDPGLFTITGRLMPQVRMDKAEAAIKNELTRMVNEGPSDYELQKVKNKVVSNLIFGEIHYLNKAMNLSQFELLGNIEKINQEPEQYRAVTPNEIISVAESVFVPENCSTLYYLPGKPNTNKA
ncbi:M16 family metallopeptidase [Marinilabilia rubra]|uniref:Peptidase M16 n=1 Tax=Marinilabilia rubra TaxID=2162893 RepID=A0A2U2B9R0_9BACT|nr:pitrilysin family protein [Marinilabilia rubra]PWD99787.1 peptidase M16 [Marinilabilia rubra]